LGYWELLFCYPWFIDKGASMKKLLLKQFSHYLQPRPRDWHKGNAGRVVIVGGDEGFSGAPRLAAEAAFRVGAGLVVIATRSEHAALLNLTRPEIMSHGIESAASLRQLIATANVIIIGPGLGQSRWAERMLATVLEAQCPLVVDADALNLLALAPHTSENWVLTPHPGEAARLLKLTVQQVQVDRVLALKALHREYKGVSVLKGAGSLVWTPKDKVASICEAGNPGMATAGMGDVLSGVIGGLIAQGIPLGDAAKLGVCVHAMAGDLAAAEGERGMVALDLMPHLRSLVNPCSER
jgi:hydroxyethylthiazole kinase-like uncharacterized protein yjeF